MNQPSLLPDAKPLTDLLVSKAEIRARNRPIRDKSGQFIRPSAALEIEVAAERMTARLKIDVPAMEHARGVVWENGHFRALPGAKLQSVESTVRHIGERAPSCPLFDQVAA